MNYSLAVASTAEGHYSRNGSLIVKTLTNYHDEEEIFATQQLRYEVFCERLKWLPPNNEKREWDQYDMYAIHFAAFSNGHGLVGYSRIIQYSKVGFMLEKDFAKILGKETLVIDKKSSIEISRLCLKPGVKNPKKISEGLYKAMYQWSFINRKRYWYIVVEKKYLAGLLRQSFPFRQIGPGFEFEPGTLSVAAVLDLDELDETLGIKRPQFMLWLGETHLEWEDSPDFEIDAG